MSSIITSLSPLLRLVIVAFVVVLAAMTVDLFAGLYKAKLRGEARRSEQWQQLVTDGAEKGITFVAL